MTIDEMRNNLQSGGNLTITVGESTTTAWASIIEDTYIIDEHLVPIHVIAELEESGLWSVDYE